MLSLFEIDNRPALYYLLRPACKKSLLQHQTRPDPTRGSTRPVDNSAYKTQFDYACTVVV